MQLAELNMQYEDVLCSKLLLEILLHNTHLGSKMNTRQAANMTKIGFV